MLGRASDREVVLTRTLGEKLVAFNPGLPDDACRDAMASVQSLQHAAGLIDLLRFEPASDRPVAKIKGEARPQAGQRRRLHLFDRVLGYAGA